MHILCSGSSILINKSLIIAVHLDQPYISCRDNIVLFLKFLNLYKKLTKDICPFLIACFVLLFLDFVFLQQLIIHLFPFGRLLFHFMIFLFPILDFQIYGI